MKINSEQARPKTGLIEVPYSELLTRLERKEYPEAKALMNGLDSLYKLNNAQAQERDDALTYINILSTAHAAGHDLMHLDNTEVARLRGVAAKGCERPALWAQNLLCFGYGECYAPCTGEGGLQKALHLPRPAPPPETPSLLSVYPNPASSFVTLAYELPEVPEHAVLVLRGIDGQELRRMPLSAKRGQQLVDTRDFVPGVYSVELFNGGVRIAAKRLVLKP